MTGWIVVIGLPLALVTYAWMAARVRRATDRLYEVPDDLKRADENQPPPFNGTAGWMP